MKRYTEIKNSKQKKLTAGRIISYYCWGQTRAIESNEIIWIWMMCDIWHLDEATSECTDTEKVVPTDKSQKLSYIFFFVAWFQIIDSIS